MGLSKIHQLEKAMVLILNLDGWDLEHSGEGFERYDPHSIFNVQRRC